MNYLIDTCTISDFFKKIPSVVKHFEAVSPKQLHISTITVMEIEYGLSLNLEREKKIRPLWIKLLEHLTILSYSPSCAEATARIRATLKAKGQPIGPYDVLIAGTAEAQSMVLVTSNINEFNRVKSIRAEDWRSE
jgi:tRNA(fMet)-specific endonuclease VapC